MGFLLFWPYMHWKFARRKHLLTLMKWNHLSTVCIHNAQVAETSNSSIRQSRTENSIVWELTNCPLKLKFYWVLLNVCNWFSILKLVFVSTSYHISSCTGTWMQSVFIRGFWSVYVVVCPFNSCCTYCSERINVHFIFSVWYLAYLCDGYKLCSHCSQFILLDLSYSIYANGNIKTRTTFKMCTVTWRGF